MFGLENKNRFINGMLALKCGKDKKQHALLRLWKDNKKSLYILNHFLQCVPTKNKHAY